MKRNITLEFPPNVSFRKNVSLESLNGTNLIFSSTKAFITVPKVVKDLEIYKAITYLSFLLLLLYPLLHLSTFAFHFQLNQPNVNEIAYLKLNRFEVQKYLIL